MPMSNSNQGLDLGDELNLYLTANGLKPASLVVLDPLNFKEGYGIRKKENYIQLRGESDMKLSSQDVEDFRKSLEGSGLYYNQNKIENRQIYNEKGKPINSEWILFQVGKDEPSLKRLLDARTDEETGLALGYPIEAVKAYNKQVNNEIRNGQYFQVSLAKAKKAGLEIPRWLAYISHVPEELDLVEGKVSETSQILGEKYQSFVRKNNPTLAEKVEEHFLNRPYPSKWEKNPDGSYVFVFK
jgi:hypothetical protein